MLLFPARHVPMLTGPCKTVLALTQKCLYFCVRMTMNKLKKTVNNQILSSIYGHKKGRVFTPMIIQTNW